MIQITATHINTLTSETLLSEVKEFATNSKAMKYLKSLEKTKMQTLASTFNLGDFKRGLIRKNKDLNWSQIKTNVKIVTT